MLRRSAHNSTPRKRYTIDAFEGIAELQQDVNEGTDSHDEGDAGFHTDVDRDDQNGHNMSDDVEGPGSEAHADVDADGAPNFDQQGPSLRRRRNMNGSSAPKLTYTRGLVESFVNGTASRSSRRRVSCGPSPIDYQPLEHALHKWGYPSPLPRRQVDQNGSGGFSLSFFDPDHGVSDSRLDIDQGLSAVSLLNPGEHVPYVDARRFHSARLLLGSSHASQELFCVGPGEAVPLPAEKPGFVLNVGARIQCLEWVPKQASSAQYLTVSLAPHDAHAFRNQPQYKSIVQIWQLSTTVDGRVAINQTPTVRMILCSEWGDVISLRWSPFGAEDRALGLLGALWTDGALRVLAIPQPNNRGGTTYLRLSEPLVEYRCPDSVFTSMTWLDQHKIAASCANGFVAVFDLNRATSRPIVYRPVTDGYITSISSCAPSRPHLVMVESLGRVVLSDLSQRQVSGQTVSSQRVRTGALHIFWSDHCQSVVTADDVRGIQALPLRRLSYMKGVGSNRAVTTTIAGSPFHPHILVGAANGEVTCLNPLQKFLGGRGAMHQQKWFVHECRRTREPTDEPVSRFVEGHKVDEIRFGPDEHKFVREDGEIGQAVVYEAETAIAALSWNPNRHVAGWAAAGLGSGIIRVEDVTV